MLTDALTDLLPYLSPLLHIARPAFAFVGAIVLGMILREENRR